MIPKSTRFNMRSDFLELKKTADKKDSDHLILYQNDDSEPRFAVVVSKKVNGKAVVRNTLKRAAKKTLLENANRTSVVVFKSKKLGKEDTKMIESELKELLAE